MTTAQAPHCVIDWGSCYPPKYRNAGGGGGAGPPAVPGDERGDADRAHVRGRRLCQEAVWRLHHPQRRVDGERAPRLLQGRQDRQDPGAPVRTAPILPCFDVSPAACSLLTFVSLFCPSYSCIPGRLEGLRSESAKHAELAHEGTLKYNTIPHRLQGAAAAGQGAAKRQQWERVGHQTNLQRHHAQPLAR